MHIAFKTKYMMVFMFMVADNCWKKKSIYVKKDK